MVWKSPKELHTYCLASWLYTMGSRVSELLLGSSAGKIKAVHCLRRGNLERIDLVDIKEILLLGLAVLVTHS